MVYVTETIVANLKAGLNPEDEDAAGAQALNRMRTTIAAQTGFRRHYWGVQMENPSKLVWSIDWYCLQCRHNTKLMGLGMMSSTKKTSSMADHIGFFLGTDSDKFKSFAASMMEAVDMEKGRPNIFHTNFTDENAAIAAREAPVTELSWAAIASNASREQKSALEDTVLSLSSVALANKCTAFSCGWVIEEIDHSSADGGKALRLTAMLGWPTIGDHEAFAHKPEAAEAMKPLFGMMLPQTEDTKLFHVKFHGKK